MPKYKAPGFIYFITTKDELKIGYTIRPKLRWREHQLQNEEKLTFVGYRPGHQLEEMIIPTTAGLTRSREREWYILDDNAKRLIESLTGLETVDPEPEEKKVTVTTYITSTDREHLKRQANLMGMKFSAYIAWLLVCATNNKPMQENRHV